MPLYKPITDHGGSAIVNPGGGTLVIKDKNGNTIATYNKPIRGTEGSKWIVDPSLASDGNTFSIDGGAPYQFSGDGSQRQEFNPTGGGAPTKVGGRGSGTPLGSAPGGLDPSRFGGGYAPKFLGNQFPQFQPIKTPDYTQFDPAQYAKTYGPVVRSEMLKNFQFSSALALGTVNNELRGLKAFEPAAAALAREQAAIDNTANQAQRTGQVNAVLPDVQKNLAQQTKDASIYASGHLPNSLDDTALSIGASSAATDLASTRGFGDNSLVGKGAQALMSAKERFQVAQYGNTLEDQNATARQNLELAPTEYINAGQQIKVTPTTDAGTLTQNYSSQANQFSQIPASTALSSSINQSQFRTNEVLDVSKYNASNVYASQLNKFNYVSGYAQQVADLGTSQVNQDRQDAQTKALTDAFNKAMSQSQTASTIQTILGSAGVGKQVIDAITSLFTGSGGKAAATSQAAGYGDINSSDTGIWAGIQQFGMDVVQFFSDLF